MAAEITPTSVSSMDSPCNHTAGTVNRRYKTLLIEGPKAAQSDWFSLGDYLSTAELDNIHSLYATTDDATNTILDTIIYTNASGKTALGTTDTGTSRLTVVYYEA